MVTDHVEALASLGDRVDATEAIGLVALEQLDYDQEVLVYLPRPLRPGCTSGTWTWGPPLEPPDPWGGGRRPP